MPNTFAYIVLFSFPLVAVILFRRLPREQALIWTILSGYLFLPPQTGINPPFLPTLDKDFIPAMMAAILCLASSGKVAEAVRAGKSRSKGRGLRVPRTQTLMNVAILLLLSIVPVGVFLTNTEPMIAGPRFIQAIRLYDVFSMALSAAVVLLPFLLARRYLATPEAARGLLHALIIAGLLYSVFCLIEIRLSPQLNRWVYGFYSHSFNQHMREGGFRPMVFVEHGLRVGIFMAMTVLAAFALFRTRPDPADAGDGSRRASRRRSKPFPYFLAFAYLFGVLVLVKSLGALLITLLLLPILLFRPKLQFIAAAVIAASVLVYPMMRGAGWVPIESIYDLAASISESRAHSFQIRTDNEKILLEKAAQKPLLGWGDWGRSRVYSERTGADISITDGVWVIYFGTRGWIGYVLTFALLCLPPIVMALKSRTMQNQQIAAALCLILAANLMDLIPNSALTPLTWLIAGTLAGLYVTDRKTVAATERGRSRGRADHRTPEGALSRRDASTAQVLRAADGTGTARRALAGSGGRGTTHAR